MRRCDVVVVGQGIFGLAAHACLVSRGVRVIALERASPGHDGASSHGDSRVTRRANFENPAYTPLFDRSASYGGSWRTRRARSTCRPACWNADRLATR